MLTVNELKNQVELLQDFRTQFDNAQSQIDNLRHKLHGTESVCSTQLGLIDIQAREIQKLKHKVRKYKRKMAQRDGNINALTQHIQILEEKQALILMGTQ